MSLPATAATAPGITAATDTAIALLVARRVQLGHIAESDREDLKQHLRMELLRRIHRYRPSAGAWSTFNRRVLDAELKRWLRHHHRACRNLHLAQSIHDEDGARLADWAAEIPADPASNAPEHNLLRADVDAVLATLPQSDRTVAEALMDQRPSDAARRLGCSRSEVYRVIERLRLAFTAAGLGA